MKNITNITQTESKKRRNGTAVKDKCTTYRPLTEKECDVVIMDLNADAVTKRIMRFEREQSELFHCFKDFQDTSTDNKDRKWLALAASVSQAFHSKYGTLPRVDVAVFHRQWSRMRHESKHGNDFRGEARETRLTDRLLEQVQGYVYADHPDDGLVKSDGHERCRDGFQGLLALVTALCDAVESKLAPAKSVSCNIGEAARVQSRIRPANTEHGINRTALIGATGRVGMGKAESKSGRKGTAFPPYEPFSIAEARALSWPIFQMESSNQYLLIQGEQRHLWQFVQDTDETLDLSLYSDILPKTAVAIFHMFRAKYGALQEIQEADITAAQEAVDQGYRFRRISTGQFLEAGLMSVVELGMLELCEELKRSHGLPEEELIDLEEGLTKALFVVVCALSNAVANKLCTLKAAEPIEEAYARVIGGGEI